MKKRCLSERICRSTCKGEVIIINSGAGSNLVEAVLRKLTTSVPFMICSSTGLSQWVRFIFFSTQYIEVKQFKWYFSSLATISPLDDFAIRLKSLRFYAAFLTRLCSSSVWHLWRFFGPSFWPQKKHISKVFLNYSSSVCSYYHHFRFPLVFVFDLAFVCYTLQYTTCETKLSFLEKLLPALLVFWSPTSSI